MRSATPRGPVRSCRLCPWGRWVNPWALWSELRDFEQTEFPPNSEEPSCEPHREAFAVGVGWLGERRLTRDVIAVTGSKVETRDQANPKVAAEFLRDEFKHLADSFLRNEDQGERRVNVFLGLVGAVAVATGLAVDRVATTGFDPRWILVGAALVLVPVGWMTLTRLIHRNLATSDYLRRMANIRRYFASLDPTVARHLPFPPTEDEGPFRQRKSRYGVERGGLVEIVAFTNSLLMASAVGLVAAIAGSPAWLTALIAAVAVVSMWAGQLEWVCRQYSKVHPTGQACPESPWRHRRNGEAFRANVGIVVLNAQGDVLALERSDIPDAWQLPQGGVRKGERLERAALRELREETGLPDDSVELVAEHPQWLAYELPEGMRKPKTGRGQAQKWFVFRLRDAAVQPTLAGRDDDEFRSWRWMSLDKLAAEAIWFRQPIYHILVDWLEEVDDPGPQGPDSS